jgi:type IX secretion system PorP/SprF family membrane protein
LFDNFATENAMKKIFITISLLLFLSGAYCQQIPIFSQYNLNHYAINPAATGVNDELPMALSYRKQWVSIPESPTVQYLSAQMKVYKAMGAGAKITNYTAGPQRKTGFELTYSYHFVLKEGLNLSLGLSGLFYQFHLDKSAMNVEQSDDVIFMGEEKMFVVDATFGAYLYGKNYFAGFSVPQLFNRNVDLKSDNVLQEKQVRHYYIHGGYRFDLNSDFTLEPSALVKLMESGLYQVDISALTEYKKMISLGITYRSSDAIVIQTAYRYKAFQLGYSYDITVSGYNTVSSGSHEIVFIYTLKNFLEKVDTYKKLDQQPN